jgi:hypothetical protein
MELAENRADYQRTLRGQDRRDYLRFLHPALILAVSFVTAAVVFLSGAELRLVFDSEVAIFKLLAGTALLFFVGIYFTQQLAARPVRSEALRTFERTADDLASMQRALKTHIESGPPPNSLQRRPGE